MYKTLVSQDRLVILTAAADQHYHKRSVSLDLQNVHATIVKGWKKHNELSRGDDLVCVFALEVSSQFDFETGG